MEEALRIDLRGEMPQARLDRLRRLLGLESRGRLSDDEDVNFGYRYLQENESNDVEFTLYRFRDTEWSVSLDYENEPPDAEVVEECRSSVLRAAAELGLSVENVWVDPIYQRES
jgi:hypothetical protein